jgi:hypothetical protein
MYMSVKGIVGEWSCICLLRVLLVNGHVYVCKGYCWRVVMYMSVKGIDGEWSCICLLRVLLVSGHVYVC